MGQGGRGGRGRGNGGGWGQGQRGAQGSNFYQALGNNNDDHDSGPGQIEVVGICISGFPCMLHHAYIAS